MSTIYEIGRRDLILKFRNIISSLIGSIHLPVAIILDESNSVVQELCILIERIFFRGICTLEFNGILPFWGLLERIEMNHPPVNCEYDLPAYI